MIKQTFLVSALSIACLAPLRTAAGAPAKRPIDEVELVGVRPKQRKAVLKTLKTRRGIPLAKAPIAADLRRLWATGRFQRVRAEQAERSGRRVVRFVVVLRAHLRTIGITGSPGLKPDRVVKLAKLKLDAPLSGADMAKAANRLRDHYRRRGYAQPVVRYTLSVSADGDTGHVSFYIARGPRFHVGRVVIADAPPRFAAKLRAIARHNLRRRQRYDPRGVARLSFLLARELRNHSHIYARAIPTVRYVPGKRRADVTYRIVLGRRARIAVVRIRGNDKTRDRVIRRELVFSPGDYYSDAALIATQRRIQALGYYKAVRVTPVPGSAPGLVDVDIEVKERRTGQFQIGIGFSSAEGFIASGRIVQHNLFGRGQLLALSAQLSTQRQLFDLTFTEPHLFGTDFSLSTSLFNTKRVWPGWVRNGTGGSITLGHPLSAHTNAYLSYRLEHTHLDQLGGGDLLSNVAPLFRGGLTSAVRATIVHDTRNDRLFPTSGLNVGGFAEVAEPALGSDSQFAKLQGWFRYYRPLFGPFRLRFNAEAGLLTSRAPLGAPLSERFQLGGITTIRGFAPGGLGPRLPIVGSDPASLNSLSLGGNLRLLSNTELEFSLSRKLGIDGVVFFDVGNVFNLEPRYCSVGKSSHSSTLCPGSFGDIVGGLRKSVGFGLRWRSPIGPLRFEWGIPLDRRPGEDKIRFHFSIGTSF